MLGLYSRMRCKNEMIYEGRSLGAGGRPVAVNPPAWNSLEIIEL